MKVNKRLLLVVGVFVVLLVVGGSQWQVQNEAPQGGASIIRAQTKEPVEEKESESQSAGGGGAVPDTMSVVNAIEKNAFNKEKMSTWGATKQLKCIAKQSTMEKSRKSDVSEDIFNNVCCTAVAGDVDYGKTMGHLISKLLCERDASLKERSRPLRVMQVGANTGDNANDHLVRFLKLGVAHAILLEPVPWIFKRLQNTYKDYGSIVHLLNAAMSGSDGNVTFTAPKESARGWIPQMGGLSLPDKTSKTVSKKGWWKYFEKISVSSVKFESLLKLTGWLPEDGFDGQQQQQDSTTLDIFVVDAEGYDDVILGMVLDVMEALTKGKKGGPGSISIIQYEWKHIKPASREQLRTRLQNLGYCVVQAHYDDIAYLASSVGLSDDRSQCSLSFQLEAINN